MRVLTWNLWWRFGPWEARREAILEVLREERPDIVGLQEVWARNGENLAAWLAGELDMHWTWDPFASPERWQKRIGDAAVDVGVAVLSRWPIAARGVAPLPADGGRDDGRSALYALLDAPGGPVPFFTVHLNSSPGESAVRCAQVRALSAFVAERRADAVFPPVVTGDFNAWPDSDEIRLFGGCLTEPAVPGQVMLDAWSYADPAAPWATWDPANPYAAQSHGPPTRIDYIHAGAPGPGGLGRVMSVRRTGDGPVRGVWPSDHAAVVADLALPPGGEPGAEPAAKGAEPGARPGPEWRPSAGHGPG
ncbi:endonuclease/exonuclease/phosphatase family protein [Streptomyces lycii]|uniref:Endonuclease n=1 Tax=Streptomyces lycii TaxID=2654337 RepID=A0ABQ7FIX8_9ACTN|nr:endonuclease/exonuclease/phosphatase family protein [Streptomyces lycii]KAF4407213.1 endonuclease [Streptomyces lycii]